MTIWLGGEYFSRSIRRSIVDDKKAGYPYFPIMIKSLRQAEDFVAHCHEDTDLTLALTDRAGINAN